jgi:phospholipid/cholesterol/gamma-HCH transport system ATP-binding protein
MTRPRHPQLDHPAAPHLTPARERVIQVRSVTKRYGNTTVLDNIDLDVFRGEVLSIVGGSGSGKTKPTSGTIHIFGEELTCQIGNDLQSMRNRWGMQFQHGALFSALSVIDNVALPMRELRTLPDAFIVRVAMLKLQMVGLKSTDADKMPSDLSGGMIKRVALARALSLEPELVFLDEPTAGLDPRASDDYVALIRELRQELGLTVVMVTHDLDTLVALSDRIAVLADRKVLAAKPVEQIIQIDHPFIKEYFLGERGKRALMALGPEMTEAVAAASLSTQED